jgi:hypothetical protein
MHEHLLSNPPSNPLAMDNPSSDPLRSFYRIVWFVSALCVVVANARQIKLVSPDYFSVSVTSFRESINDPTETLKHSARPNMMMIMPSCLSLESPESSGNIHATKVAIEQYCEFLSSIITYILSSSHLTNPYRTIGPANLSRPVSSLQTQK